MSSDLEVRAEMIRIENVLEDTYRDLYAVILENMSQKRRDLLFTSIGEVRRACANVYVASRIERIER